MSRRLPARAEVEGWLRHIFNDLDYLYDGTLEKCGPYRWARSGLDTMRSSTGGSRSSDVSDPTGSAGLRERFSVEDVRNAAYQIQVAMESLARARRLLTLPEGRAPEDGPILPGWVSQAEHQLLVQRQKERQLRGVGYGDG
jgi:hypothetical protein